jgi:hypothetical protein
MKTATTSLCGLLNSHPDVLVMCEVDLNNTCPTRYGRKLLKGYPDALEFFFRPVGADFLNNYSRLQQNFAKAGFARRYLGDKFATIDSGYSVWMQDAPVVFSVRHLSEWLAKDSVRKTYPLDGNIVPFAAQYTTHFLESFLLARVHHVRLDDFLSDNPKVVAGIWKFLGLTAPHECEKWWETIGHYAEGDPKLLMDWWKGHASSAVGPQPNDTLVELNSHAFWDAILPIFDHYYALAAAGEGASPARVRQDIKMVEGLVGRFHLPLDLAYKKHASVSRNAHFRSVRRVKKKLSLKERLLRLVAQNS